MRIRARTQLESQVQNGSVSGYFNKLGRTNFSGQTGATIQPRPQVTVAGS
jgi:hypothetical protein